MKTTGFSLCKYIQFEKSGAGISHMLMDIWFNLMSFTGFFYKEMFTSFISFSSRDIFSLNLLLKASVVQAKNYEFLQFCLCGQPYLFRCISQTSELNSTTETFSASMGFIHFHELCNYLHSFQKQPAAKFFKNNCCFPDQKHVTSTNLLKQDLTFSSNTF